MPENNPKRLAVLPTKSPSNIPSFKPFYANLPPLPKVDLPLSRLFVALDRQLVYQGPGGEYRSVIAEIERTLDGDFGVRKLIHGGSSKAGTGIRERCDIDVLVCLRYSSVSSDSRVMLREVYECLQQKFGAAARLDPPAVVVSFGPSPGEQVDVVPMFDMNDQDNLVEAGHSDYVPPLATEQFFLPGFAGEWLPTNPAHHTMSVDKTDASQGGKMRRLIRLLKAWKYGHDIPLISYYLESFVLHLAREEQFSDSPHLDMFKVLNCINYIFKQPNVSIVDPNIYSDWGRIVPCRREIFPNIEEAVEKTAYLATLAMDAEWRGDLDPAAGIWSSLFHRQIA